MTKEQSLEVMDNTQQNASSPQSPGIRRAQRACGNCKKKKLKCDGSHPCRRCISSGHQCSFTASVREDPRMGRVYLVEGKVTDLNTKLNDQARILDQLVTNVDQITARVASHPSPSSVDAHSPANIQNRHLGSVSNPSLDTLSPQPWNPEIDAGQNPGTPWQGLQASSPSWPGNRRIQSVSKQSYECCPNVESRGLVSASQSRLFYNEFFRGCHTGAPLFDLQVDTYDVIKSSCSMLFDVIISVGAGILLGNDADLSRQLLSDVNKSLSRALIYSATKNIDWVRAFAVHACYISSGWHMIATAARLALDLKLDYAVDELLHAISLAKSRFECLKKGQAQNFDRRLYHSEYELAARVRVWAVIYNLVFIFDLACGRLPAFPICNYKKYRLLLEYSFTTESDIGLFAQVELTSIRAKAHQYLSPHEMPELSVATAYLRQVSDELNIWYCDWKNFFRLFQDGFANSMPYSLLQIQREHAEMLIYCRILQSMNFNNILHIPPSHLAIVFQINQNADKYISILTSMSELDLKAYFRYSIQYSRAKNVFSLLTTMKSSLVLPARDTLRNTTDRVAFLHNTLSTCVAPGEPYCELLADRLLEFNRATHELITAAGEHDELSIREFVLSENGSNVQAFLSFIPEQFKLIWDFPGLGLFSRPAQPEEQVYHVEGEGAEL